MARRKVIAEQDPGEPPVALRVYLNPHVDLEVAAGMARAYEAADEQGRREMANRLLAGHIEVAGSGGVGVAAGSEILTVQALLIDEIGAVVRQRVGRAVSALAVGGTDRGVICRAGPKGSCVAAGRPVGVVRRENLLHFPVSAVGISARYFPGGHGQVPSPALWVRQVVVEKARPDRPGGGRG